MREPNIPRMFLLAGWVLLPACILLSFNQCLAMNPSQTLLDPMQTQQDTVTLGGGCFWCVEAVYASIHGVSKVTSGYAGGHIKNPAYREVCTGRTGHAEVVQVVFDPEVVSLSSLLDVFFAVHDPTTLNRQGADVGTQYRSVVYWHKASQVHAIEEAIARAGQRWPDPIVTEVGACGPFYAAEDYHQSYYELHGEAPYCKAVIAPKMAKFTQEFRPLLQSTPSND